MHLKPRLSEAREGFLLMIACDRCGRLIDGILSEYWLDKVKAGKLYATPRTNTCWRCLCGLTTPDEDPAHVD